MNLYSLYKKHPVICTDSRNCPAGSLFFALKGDNFNANAFALSALEQGCAYAVVDEAEYAIDERFILVDDVLKNLQSLAAYHRRQLDIVVVGITGTNGKTTTKELIAAVLSEKYKLHFTQGNLNNHIGVPLTLLQITENHEMAVIEMGANHQGEIKFLSDIVRPNYGIITNVGKAHLEGFGSFEVIKRTKAELYNNIVQTGKGVFIHQDNAQLMGMAQLAGFDNDDHRLLKYSTVDSHASVYGQVSSCSPLLHMTCKLSGSAEFEIHTQLIGAYNAENVLAAVAIGNFFGLSEGEITTGLEKYRPQNNRSQLTVTESNHLIVDAYNANPSSMHAAISNFAQMDARPKVLILGDMLELGEQSDQEHQKIVELLQSYSFDQVILVGKVFAANREGFLSFDDVAATINYLENHPIKQSYVLIKGSRGIRLEKIINVL